jgi:hypothetical protein
MVADRRADISVAMAGRKILCELNRDYHGDVWTAAEEQLERYRASRIAVLVIDVSGSAR